MNNEQNGGLNCIDLTTLKCLENPNHIWNVIPRHVFSSWSKILIREFVLKYNFGLLN